MDLANDGQERHADTRRYAEFRQHLERGRSRWEGDVEKGRMMRMMMRRRIRRRRSLICHQNCRRMETWFGEAGGVGRARRRRGKGEWKRSSESV